MASNGQQTELFIPGGAFDIIEVKRGQQRYDRITIGSWWARKNKPGDVAELGEWSDAYRIEEIVPSLPMNRVRLSRCTRTIITVNALVNAWFPVKPHKGVQPRERLKGRAPSKKAAERATVAELQQEVETLRAEFNALRKALGS